jgi:hypothetical protein
MSREATLTLRLTEGLWTWNVISIKQHNKQKQNKDTKLGMQLHASSE